MGITSNHSNLFYNARLRRNARALRKKMTKGHACLWKYDLRAGALKSYGFRKERPVLKYIADFMCLKLMLVIEVDGATHFLEDLIRRDGKKQNDLEAAGFKVLRFTDTDVLTNIKGVISVIENTVSCRKRN